MKRINESFLKGINCILMSLLTWLGFSCSDDGEDQVLMYGTPHATYSIKGKVTDAEKQPVTNAEIRISSDLNEKYDRSWLHPDTLQTDVDGNFSWATSTLTLPGITFRLITTAPESEEGIQTLKIDTTFVYFDSVKLTGGDGDWFLGEAEKEINITLEKFIDPHTAPYYLFTLSGQIMDDESPLPGIEIRTTPDDSVPYVAITDTWGKYSFTIDPDTLSELTLYTTLYSGFWIDTTIYQSDSITINLDEIELSKGSGMLIGKGSKEINFTLKRK